MRSRCSRSSHGPCSMYINQLKGWGLVCTYWSEIHGTWAIHGSCSLSGIIITSGFDSLWPNIEFRSLVKYGADLVSIWRHSIAVVVFVLPENSKRSAEMAPSGPNVNCAHCLMCDPYWIDIFTSPCVTFSRLQDLKGEKVENTSWPNIFFSLVTVKNYPISHVFIRSTQTVFQRQRTNSSRLTSVSVMLRPITVMITTFHPQIERYVNKIEYLITEYEENIPARSTSAPMDLCIFIYHSVIHNRWRWPWS